VFIIIHILSSPFSILLSLAAERSGLEFSTFIGICTIRPAVANVWELGVLLLGRSKRVRARRLRRALRKFACDLLDCARDYSFSIRRDLTIFSSAFCFRVVGVSDEYSPSNGLGW